MKRKVFPVLFMILSVAFMVGNIYYIIIYMDEIKSFGDRTVYLDYVGYYTVLIINFFVKIIVDIMFFLTNAIKQNSLSKELCVSFCG